MRPSTSISDLIRLIRYRVAMSEGALFCCVCACVRVWLFCVCLLVLFSAGSRVCVALLLLCCYPPMLQPSQDPHCVSADFGHAMGPALTITSLSWTLVSASMIIQYSVHDFPHLVMINYMHYCHIFRIVWLIRISTLVMIRVAMGHVASISFADNWTLVVCCIGWSNWFEIK